MKFEQYHISKAIKENLSRLGFKRPTDIQYKSIPSIMNGEDVLAIAQTGTGKTAAFAIPIIDRIHRKKQSKRSLGIQCIVMVPTRELAAQIGTVFNELAKKTKVSCYAVIGGVDQDPQIEKISKGIDLLVATPGRMFDLISQKVIHIQAVETLVLDEADHMLDQGFLRDIQSIKKMLRQKHQTLFFSATISKKIKKLAFSQVKSSAIRIQISPDDPVSKNVSHYLMYVEMDDKRFYLRRFIKDHPKEKILVFVRTRVRADRVVKALERSGIQSLALHGQKEQADRENVLASFKHGTDRVLVATDVSARGIDIPDVGYVINYDLPEKAENYVHRVGRTGRGIKKGSAVSFCSSEERQQLADIEQVLTHKIEEIPINRDDHDITMSFFGTDQDVLSLIRDQEKWEKQKRGKKRKK